MMVPQEDDLARLSQALKRNRAGNRSTVRYDLALVTPDARLLLRLLQERRLTEWTAREHAVFQRIEARLVRFARLHGGVA